MTSGQTEHFSFECPILAEIYPNNCRVKVSATCISDDPENPKITVNGCTDEKFCGLDFIPPRSIYSTTDVMLQKCHQECNYQSRCPLTSYSDGITSFTWRKCPFEEISTKYEFL